MSPHSPPDELPSWFVIKMTAIASLGGVLFGYDLGAISGALPQLKSYFNLAESQEEWIVSILYLGGGLGAAVGGTFCDYFGRRTSILWTDIVFVTGAIWLYFANSYVHVLWGRFVVGIAIAVSGVADVSYLHEIAPQEWRGAIVSTNEACISLGFLLAYVAGYAYSGRDNDEEWRIIFGWAGVVALVQFIGMWKMPESPLWLAEKGRIEESRLAWLEINNGGNNNCGGDDPNNNDIIIGSSTSPATSLGDDVDQASSGDVGVGVGFDEGGGGTDSFTFSPPPPAAAAAAATATSGNKTPDNGTDGDHDHHDHEPMVVKNYHNSPGPITIDVDSSSPTSPTNPSAMLPYVDNNNNNALRSVLSRLGAKLRSIHLGLSRYRRQVYIALFLAVTQQLCGQTNVLSYAPSIFAKAAGEDEAPAWAPVIIGAVKFVVTVLVIWRIEFIGRRILLILGISLIAIGQFALIVAFGGSKSDDPDTWTTNFRSFHLALPGVLLVVSGYSMSYGPLTWLLTSELFPTDIRGRALGVSTIITYLSAAFVTRTFLSAQSALGPSKVFALYCIIASAGAIFAFLAIPDTGEKTPDQVEDAIQQMWWWKYGAFALSQNEEDVSHRPPSSVDGLYKVKENASSRIELVSSSQNLKRYDKEVV